MTTTIDLRATEVKILFTAGSDGIFKMDLTELFESLSGVTFELNAYDGPDPDSDSEVDINYTTETEGLNVYCTLESTQADMDNNTRYWFYFNAVSGEDVQPLCYGTLTRKGLS